MLVVALSTLLAGILALGAATLAGTAHASRATEPSSYPKPTIVLVHGAFADSSGVERRRREAHARRLRGHRVLQPPAQPTGRRRVPAPVLSTISGPIVLVGHSYGGAVITHGATGNPNVKSLVYVAAYALDQGERVSAANDLGGGHTDVTRHLVVRPYPGAPAGDGDAYIDPAWFHQLFAQDLPRSTTDLMGATQRPGALGALVTPQAPRRGRPSPAGTWSPSRTASSRRRPSGSWRPARTPRQSASTARTSR